MKIKEKIQSGKIPDNELIEILDAGHKKLGTMSLTEFANVLGVRNSRILQVKKYRQNEVIINGKKYYKV